MQRNRKTNRMQTVKRRASAHHKTGQLINAHHKMGFLPVRAESTRFFSVVQCNRSSSFERPTLCQTARMLPYARSAYMLIYAKRDRVRREPIKTVLPRDEESFFFWRPGWPLVARPSFLRRLQNFFQNIMNIGRLNPINQTIVKINVIAFVTILGQASEI